MHNADILYINIKLYIKLWYYFYNKVSSSNSLLCIAFKAECVFTDVIKIDTRLSSQAIISTLIFISSKISNIIEAIFIFIVSDNATVDIIDLFLS